MMVNAMAALKQGTKFTGLVLALLFFITSAPTLGQQGHDQQGEHRHQGPRDTKQYLEMLDSPERDKDQKPSQVVETLGLRPGMAVADLGSGSGYFTRRFVEAVTDTGKVYAVDVEPEMLTYAEQSLVHMHIPYTAEFILARPDSPKLPTGAVDLVFVCNVYHHLENRPTYF